MPQMWKCFGALDVHRCRSTLPTPGAHAHGHGALNQWQLGLCSARRMSMRRHNHRLGCTPSHCRQRNELVDGLRLICRDLSVKACTPRHRSLECAHTLTPCIIHATVRAAIDMASDTHSRLILTLAWLADGLSQAMQTWNTGPARKTTGEMPAASMGLGLASTSWSWRDHTWSILASPDLELIAMIDENDAMLKQTSSAGNAQTGDSQPGSPRAMASVAASRS